MCRLSSISASSLTFRTASSRTCRLSLHTDWQRKWYKIINFLSTIKISRNIKLCVLIYFQCHYCTTSGRKPSFTHLNYQQPPLTKLPVCYFRSQQLMCNWGSMFWNCILTVLTMDFAHIRSTYSTFPSFYCLMPYSCNRKSGWLLDLSHVVFRLSTIQTL